MSLADHVLALHNGINEVFILEDRGGDHVVMAEAARNGLTLLADSMDRAAKHGFLAPMIILGAASQCMGSPCREVACVSPNSSGRGYLSGCGSAMGGFRFVSISTLEYSQTISG